MRLGIKMALATLCVVSVLFGACGGILISSSFHSSLAREKASVCDSYQTLIDMLLVMDSLGELDTREDIADVMDKLNMRESAAWTAVRLSSEGTVVYEEAGGFLSHYLALAGQASNAQDPDHAQLSVVDDDGAMSAILVRGSCNIGEREVRLDLARDITALAVSRDEQLSAFRIAFFALVASCAVLTFASAFALTRPLAKLSRAAHEIAGGNLTSRSEVRSDDEVGSLSKDFDIMAVQIERSVEGMRDLLARQQRFMGSFAHEMKTPMTSVIGYADLMRRDGLTDSERKQASEYIFDEGRRLEALSSKLLELFLLDDRAIELDFVEVKPLIDGVCAPLAASWQRNGVHLEWDSEEGVCEMDSDLACSLLVNLLENARRATDDSPDPNIELRCAFCHGACKVSVTDNGRGMSPDDIDRVTEEFYRVDKARSRAQGGAGIGLSLCARIMEAHGGDLRITSKLGEGTCVTALFPEAQA